MKAIVIKEQDKVIHCEQVAEITTAQFWWLRSPLTGDGSGARYVNTSGYVNLNYALIGNQAAVVFAII